MKIGNLGGQFVLKLNNPLFSCPRPVEGKIRHCRADVFSMVGLVVVSSCQFWKGSDKYICWNTTGCYYYYCLTRIILPNLAKFG
jgi:hypothetical protein